VCPTTCEVDNGQFEHEGATSEGQADPHGWQHKKNIKHGRHKFARGSRFWGSKFKGCVTDWAKGKGKHIVNVTRHSKTGQDCDWNGALNHRLVSTHNVYLINEHDSFSKHRCYRFDEKCVCECLDDDQFYQDGTLQGKHAGIRGVASPGGPNDPKKVTWSGKPQLEYRQGHRGALEGNSVQSIASLKEEDSFWKAPNYYVTNAEIEGLKKCCFDTNPASTDAIFHTHDCGSIIKMPDWKLKQEIEAAEPTFSNTDIIRWLIKKGCYTGHLPKSQHQHFAL
jgi:hypothetical protein